MSPRAAAPRPPDPTPVCTPKPYAMTIRTKLLSLLLAIALLPLVLVAMLDSHGVMRLGRTLAADAREALTQRTGEQLQQLIAEQAALVRRQRELLEYALRAQAREVEKRLAQEPPGTATVLLSGDYDEPATSPADLVPSTRHFRFTPDGGGTPLRVSYAQQVYALAPGVRREVVAEDLARLSTMPAEYAFLRGAFQELMYWQFTSLQSGVHTAYPGHGGYPEDYDPRTRPWYRLTRERGRLIWVGPYFDVSSEELILTVCMPVRRPNGSFAGVTGIDVTVADVVADMRPARMWSDEAESMLVMLKADPENPARRRVAAVAKPGYHRRGQRWNDQFQTEWLESDDPRSFGDFVSDLEERRSGYSLMPYRGRESLWVYGPVDEQGTSLVTIVPHELVVARARAAEREALERTWSQLRSTGGLAVLVLLIVLLCALVGSRHVTQPIREMAAAADRVARGELDARVAVRSTDELGRLGRTFNAMVPQLRERLAMKHSLALAMEVQQNLLPHAPPRADGLDIAGASLYCDETGGDYFDYLDLDGSGTRSLGIAVGDVTGHGIAAAMLMTTGRALLRSRAAQPGSLSEMMNGLNRVLDADLGNDRFMTLFYLVMEVQARRIRWATAGHDAAITYDPGADAFGELSGCDIPLGIDPDWRYSEHGPRTLVPGEIIVIGTDGIWETRDPLGRFFGKEALQAVIRRHAARPAAELCAAITDAVRQFRQDRPQEDDVTLVVVKQVGAALTSPGTASGEPARG